MQLWETISFCANNKIEIYFYLLNFTVKYTKKCKKCNFVRMKHIIINVLLLSLNILSKIPICILGNADGTAL
jgi:hypothetical protein